MWTRKELKSRAKDVLRTSYWKAFLVSLIIGFVGGNGGSGSSIPSNLFNGLDPDTWNLDGGSSYNRHNASSGRDSFTEIFRDMMDNETLLIILIFVVIFLGIMLFAMAFRIFLCYSLEVGGRRYFVRNAQGDNNLNHIEYGFRKNKYLAIVKSMLWKDFLNFLWFLLLIIPGIVKSYAYRMVPYILADNANIGYKRAVELSNRMTAGHKFKMWVLDLSFIGWYLLGCIALFVGVLFVMPYENATKAELYLVLRQNLLDNHECSYEELDLIVQ
ncbi:DUF975 family protein [Paenibacillus sp. FSL H7-0331]|uniref:DUF975 family protein n=1 Tax=Paenibacillus sp. FSL H7-0331 TaxID=1920421 RepID=UPI00096DD7D0|nr:DUF975 family protein [Paenibacillus sp. FSL H7-0331]OMF09029.1 hypothetical protein BK127_27760 [Paenibacillus sp. FSL H7-0331]